MSSQTKSPWNPDRLDVRAFAQAKAQLNTCDSLTRFDRLLAELPTGVTADGREVRWTARGEQRLNSPGSEPSNWLHLRAWVDLPLSCQRCLAPVDMPLVVDRWFRFVADEHIAAAEDEDSQEDVLALEPRPSLRVLIEDELLMELPLVPMHEHCPQPLPALETSVAAATPALAAPRDHPFAQLSRLRK